jgi:transposase, IS6 family
MRPTLRSKERDRYLYRAVDSTGQTIDFLLTAKRDAAAVKRFFRQALAGLNNPQPRVINVDKNPACVPAVTELKSEGVLRQRCRLRQCKYRTVKKRVRLAKGYGSFHSAWRTIRGAEAVHLIRKGRVRRVAKHSSLAQARFISILFGVAI